MPQKKQYFAITVLLALGLLFSSGVVQANTTIPPQAANHLPRKNLTLFFVLNPDIEVKRGEQIGLHFHWIGKTRENCKKFTDIIDITFEIDQQVITSAESYFSDQIERTTFQGESAYRIQWVMPLLSLKKGVHEWSLTLHYTQDICDGLGYCFEAGTIGGPSGVIKVTSNNK